MCLMRAVNYSIQKHFVISGIAICPTAYYTPHEQFSVLIYSFCLWAMSHQKECTHVQAHMYKHTHTHTHKPTHLALKHRLVNEGIQLQYRALMIWGRQKLHKSTPPPTYITHIHTHTSNTTRLQILSTPSLCNLCMKWAQTFKSTVTTEIRLNSFLGPLTVKSLTQRWSSDYFTRT